MFEPSIIERLEDVKTSLEESGNRDGCHVCFGDDAVEIAVKLRNSQNYGPTTLVKGDVFSIPAKYEEFESLLIARTFKPNQEPCIGLLVAVKRGGRDVIIQVFLSAFTRGMTSTKEGNCIQYPCGQPADDVRKVHTNAYQALSILRGKTIKVDDCRKEECWIPKHDFNICQLSKSDYERRKVPILSFSYLKKQNKKYYRAKVASAIRLMCESLDELNNKIHKNGYIVIGDIDVCYYYKIDSCYGSNKGYYGKNLGDAFFSSYGSYVQKSITKIMVEKEDGSFEEIEIPNLSKLCFERQNFFWDDFLLKE